MSKLHIDKKLEQIKLLSVITNDVNYGTFSYLECQVHDTSFSFTDSTGSDWCIKCLKEKLDD